MSQNQNSNDNYHKGEGVGMIPFADAFDSGLNGFIINGFKQIFKLGVAYVKRMLAVGTDPFFRRDMGDRYFTTISFRLGCSLWPIAGFASCVVWMLLSGLLYSMGYETLASFFHMPIMPIVSGIVSLAVFFAFRHFGKENLNRVAKFRSEGKMYHSQSFGVPRFEPDAERSIFIYGSLALFLLAPAAGVAFFVSKAMSESFAAQQQQAFWDRYLDAMDARLEGELLQDALLGKRPAELTFIHRPLPPTQNPQVRQDIAAAVAGKVKVVAQETNEKAPDAPTQSSTPTPSDTTKKPNSPYASSGVAPTSATELKAQISKSIESVKTEAVKVLQTPTVRQGATVARTPKLWKIVAGVCLIIGLAWGGIAEFQKIKARKLQEASAQAQATLIPATTNVPAPLAPAIAEATQEKTVPQLQTNSATDATTTQPTAEAVQAERDQIAQKEEKARLAEKAREAEQAAALVTKQEQEIIERDKIKSQIADLINAQLIQIPKFQTNCSQSITAALKATGFFSTKSRIAIKQLQDTINKSAESQDAALQTWQTQLPLFSETPSSSWQGQLEKVKKNTQAMAAQRDQLAAQLEALKTSGAK